MTKRTFVDVFFTDTSSLSVSEMKKKVTCSRRRRLRLAVISSGTFCAPPDYYDIESSQYVLMNN
jgi:hypothetical protein